MYEKDRRIVITLDAGGTNFVFGAVQGDRFVVEPITLPSNSDRLDRCLETMVEGFRTVISRLPEQPAAISFAFPGPADYPRGIIGGYLPNFPSFRDGVALKDFLEERFGIPTFINNDGDLYAYGEALAGALPEINARLEAAGSAKRFRNLIGYTWGTGFGVGIVSDNRLHIGDNSCVETFCLRHKDLPDINVEEGVSIRAVKRLYAEYAGVDDDTLDPKAIFEIAEGERPGDADAARRAFARFGEVAGDAMATAVTLIDGLIVIGGGITAARKYILPSLLAEMRGSLHTFSGETLPRVQMKVYDLDDATQFAAFAQGDSRRIKVYGSDREIVYDAQKRIGVMTSHIGASRAISLGAYAFALNSIDRDARGRRLRHERDSPLPQQIAAGANQRKRDGQLRLCRSTAAAKRIRSRVGANRAKPLSIPQSWMTPLKRTVVVSTPASSNRRPIASPSSRKMSFSATAISVGGRPNSSSREALTGDRRISSRARASVVYRSNIHFINGAVRKRSPP